MSRFQIAEGHRPPPVRAIRNEWRYDLEKRSREEMGMSRSTDPKFDSEKQYSAAELSRREFVAVAAAVAAGGFVRHPGQARSAIVQQP